MLHRPILAALLSLAAASTTRPLPAPPLQPDTGPGGRDYPHARVHVTVLGSGAAEVHLFEPADPSPERAPVVVFGHGWAAMDPNIYGAWITHVVRRGHTVIVPRYQASIRTPVREFTGHALAATRAALDQLQRAGHVAPDPRGIVFAGHSMGGLVAANLAALAARGELPAPRALFSVMPGKTWPSPSPIAFPLADLSVLPPDMLLVTLVGDDDDFVGEIDARKVHRGAANVAADNKSYVRLRSDDRGATTLLAGHRAPTAPAVLVVPPAVDERREIGDGGDRGPMVTDALDYYGTWKLLDGLTDAVFRDRHRQFAIGGTREQRFMGVWSDGVPVRELQVLEP